MSEILLFQLLFLVIGFILGFFIAKAQFKGASEEEIKSKYVLKEIYEHLQVQATNLKEDLAFSEQEIRQLSALQSADQTKLSYLEEKLANQKKDLQQLQQQSQLEFEQLASKLLEEKSERFTLQNKTQLEGLLQPLRERIKEFNENVEHKFLEETKQRITLKQEIEHLRLLNTQLSQDANNLVAALRGESKTQGDWGEFRLELLLEKAGLEKGIHYKVQPSFTDYEGKQKRPDFIIQLPEKKHLIIDSKVSLSAYEQFFSCENEQEKKLHLKQHIESIQRHIKDLNSKNYQQLYQIHSPDYLLLFVPIEPAFSVAMQHSPRLFLDALEQNIVIVTSSTLLATMRTVAYIWKQERQKKNVLEIAWQSGLLYDKFVGFIDDLKQIGQRLEDAQSAYQAAFNKLKSSPKYGDTLIGRAQRIKQLGAKASKSLPENLTEEDELE